MSFVGTRPEVTKYVKKYTKEMRACCSRNTSFFGGISIFDDISIGKIR